MFYKYVVSALGKLADGPAPPLPTIAPPSLNPPLPRDVYTTAKQSKDTLDLQLRHALIVEIRPPLPMK